MKRFIPNMIYCAIFGLFTACGSHSKSEDDGRPILTLGEESFAVVQDSGLSVKDKVIVGIGTLLHTKALLSQSSGRHWTLEAALPVAAKLSLQAFSDKDAANGLRLSFENKAGTLKVTLGSGDKDVDLSDKFKGKDAANISYQIDIHNDETPAHVLIWSGSETNFSASTALVNTEDEPNAPGNGKGSFWGVSLESAQLTTLTSKEAKFED